MAKLATITQLSPTMKEGVFVEWQKKEGDTVKPGDILAAIETDKAVMDLESYEAGVVLKLIARKGDKLPVGAPVAVIGQAGENFDALLSGINTAPKPAAAAQPATPATATVSAPAAPPVAVAQAQVAETGRVKASPLAKKLAGQNGIDLKTIQGTGPGGRIVSRDLNAGTALPARATTSSSIVIHAAHGQRVPDTTLPLSPMRQTIAERLTYAKQNVPHFYLSRTINVTSLIKLREETNKGLAALQAQENPENSHLPKKVSINDFIIAAAAQSLLRHPEVLRQYGGNNIVQLGNVDVGFAVSIDDGLITPVIRNADQYSLFQIAAAAQELGSRARARRLKPDEYTGAGFTVSNLGMLGISSFQAIINAPEACILAVGTSERRPYEGKNGEILFGDFMALNLACDHRVVDGAVGAKFLATLAQYLENPGLIR